MHRSILRASLAALTLALAACTGSGNPEPRASTPSASTNGTFVDTATPVFSNPTEITNPLFPVSIVEHAVQLGVDGDAALRVEVTLLPDTRTITVDDTPVEVRVHQFIAYLDDQIVETAVDFYAQDDSGAVWYLGEEVDNYEHGVIADHEGTWLAGRDGPAGMIMPAAPEVGHRYRPENIPGLVYEEVTVQAITTVPGPRGLVADAIIVEERLMDGLLETKTFAPGYGEFAARVDAEVVELAVASPTDDLGPEPEALTALIDAAMRAADAEHPEAGTLRRLRDPWDAIKADRPPVLVAQMELALTGVADALDHGMFDDVRAAARAVVRIGADLRLQHASLLSVDALRLQVLIRQLAIDREYPRRTEGRASAIRWTWDRVSHLASPDVAGRVEDAIQAIEAGAQVSSVPRGLLVRLLAELAPLTAS